MAGSPSSADDSVTEQDVFGLRRLAGRIGAVRGFDDRVAFASTPHKTSTMDSVIHYDDNSGRDVSGLHITTPGASQSTSTWHDKYVDDVNVGEILPLSGADFHVTERQQMRTVHAIGCQQSFDTINFNVKRLGMVVNPSKTQLLCVSGSNYCRTSCFREAGSSRISSQESMTLLGFCFGTRPNADEHIALIKRKFNARSWIPRHLKGAGVPAKDICKIYTTIIRSSIELSLIHI